MKKLLIVLALIIGTSVSAQKRPRFNKINVKTSGKNFVITFNTQRADFVDFRKKGDREGYVPLDKTNDRWEIPATYGTYKIQALNSKKISEKKVRILKVVGSITIHPGSQHSTEGQNSTLHIDVKGKIVGKGHTVYIGKNNMKGTILANGQYGNGHSYLIVYLDVPVPFESKFGATTSMAELPTQRYIWFKQSI